MPKERNYWTDSAILDLPPEHEGKDHIIYHPTIHRFGIRFRETGARTFVLKYSAGGKPKTHTIGRVGAMTLSDAELAAQKAWVGLQSPDTYKDPNLERQRQKSLHDDKFETFIDAFLKDQTRDRNSAAYVQRQETHLREYFQAFHGMPILKIDRGMVSGQLKRIADGWTNPETRRQRGGKIASTLARATLSSYFRWLIGEGSVCGLEASPVALTKKYLPAQRTRWLTPDEIAIVWNAVGDDSQFGRIVRLLILTGARREQIGGLRKSELDLAKAMITLPPKGIREGGSKNDQVFEIPLSRQARHILELERSPGGPQFFGNGRGEGGFSGWSKSVARLNKQLGDQIKTPWTLHDLRRTVVTNMLRECKLQPHVVDACINHKPEHRQGVAGIYQQHDMLVERVAAMNVWGDYVESLTGTPPKPGIRLVHAA